MAGAAGCRRDRRHHPKKATWDGPITVRPDMVAENAVLCHCDFIQGQSAMQDRWPDIPYPAWQETCTTLHMWLQIVGKYRLARTPWRNHSWHATLYLTARGLDTGLVPDEGASVQVEFDLL